MKIYNVQYLSMAGTFRAVVMARTEEKAKKIFYECSPNEILEENSTVFELGQGKSKHEQLILFKAPVV